ncbi:MAG: UbiA family prenyltransferase [Bacteroidales bacterium]|nr:UbiA family prenyltransferase [Bacteroidota bacterium]MBL6950785.1 UbiA family prenyltransferase [Bacteroidales bacterium]
MSTIKNYFSLVKISHTIFSIPFAMIGFFLAIRENVENIDFIILFLVLLCVFFARNAAMGFNRYIDREFDQKNPRTALREIPNAIISPRSALLFVILNSVLFITATAFINPLCLILSPVALLVVLGYSFTKRFTYLSHVFLGLGLALAPIGAYLAVTGEFALLPLLFSFCVLFWVAGFDIIYALQDIEFDRDENLKSIPVTMGARNSLILSAFFHLIALSMLIAAGIIGPFNLVYWIGLVIFTVLITYQHLIVKPSDFSRVNLAFATLNGIASVLFACFVIADLYVNW